MGLRSTVRRLRARPDPGDRAEREWDEQARGETATQRLDRNWSVLIQELRVLQTGVQVLAGFLLIVPFQSRFDVLDDAGVAVYLVTVGAALLAVAFLLAPIALHRMLFRRHSLRRVVAVTHRETMVGLGALALALAGSATLVVRAATASWWAAAAAGIVASVVLTWLWVGVPLRALDSLERSDRSGGPDQE
ncbi:DUF6328 family protein [Gordonia sp. PP30]|uniref:DUF6328 family protein n=1 Tax=unclassified Gordonia (in: high G+C Gram-positive bacteria) TaxID=2657482 RepID=UPI001FFF9157|nr:MULTISPECIES: DUF6328 family protein [unclassified Gordonia (in: high G+C Gram-positive bacteria)]UQE76841.1 DUF6328 family protein [Gordonia sp. PP30]